MINDGIFIIKASKCKRCGGLLTSKQAVKDGYGHICKMKAKAEEEARKPDTNQVSLFDLLNLELENEDNEMEE